MISESKRYAWLTKRGWAVVLVALLVLVAGAVVAQAAGTGARDEPLTRFVFKVQIDGVVSETAFFKSVSGLSVETEVVEYQDGGTNTILKRPGPTRWPNLVLKRGFTGDEAFFRWARMNTTGNVEMKAGSITMVDAKGIVVARWTFAKGWPVKWVGPELDASKNEIAIETLEIAHEGLTYGNK
jgi:phage tail-like protein